MPLSPNSKLGPYEIKSTLGVGGMGEVYRARDSRLNRDVAIKVLRSDSAATPELKSRFEREARAVAALNHPNINAQSFRIVSKLGISDAVAEYGEPPVIRRLNLTRATLNAIPKYPWGQLANPENKKMGRRRNGTKAF
jgi:serine/threonine protein kinase